MKLKVTFKDPDGVWDCTCDVVSKEVDAIEGVGFSERAAIAESRHGKLMEQLGEWIDGGEYITIEFDTDAKTATVCKQK